MIEPIKYANSTPAVRAPCAEIPNDRRDQHRENHGKPRLGANLHNEFDRQQGTMPKATAPVENNTPRKLKEPTRLRQSAAPAEWV